MTEERPREGDDADGEREPGPSAPVQRARRMANVFVLVLSVAFVGSSTWQIIAAVFGKGIEPLPAGAPADSPEAQCGTGIRSLAQALDRAGGRLAPVAIAADDTAIMDTLRPALSPEWDRADTVRAACDRAARGSSAWAALQRLRVAEEQSGRLDHDALSSVRRDVAAHLPADLR
jgi:hypothetical protein